MILQDSLVLDGTINKFGLPENLFEELEKNAVLQKD